MDLDKVIALPFSEEDEGLCYSKVGAFTAQQHELPPRASLLATAPHSGLLLLAHSEPTGNSIVVVKDVQALCKASAAVDVTSVPPELCHVRLPLPATCIACSWSPDGSLAAAICSDGHVVFFDASALWNGAAAVVRELEEPGTRALAWLSSTACVLQRGQDLLHISLTSPSEPAKLATSVSCVAVSGRLLAYATDVDFVPQVVLARITHPPQLEALVQYELPVTAPPEQIRIDSLTFLSPTSLILQALQSADEEVLLALLETDSATQPTAITLALAPNPIFHSLRTDPPNPSGGPAYPARSFDGGPYMQRTVFPEPFSAALITSSVVGVNDVLLLRSLKQVDEDTGASWAEVDVELDGLKLKLPNTPGPAIDNFVIGLAPLVTNPGVHIEHPTNAECPPAKEVPQVAVLLSGGQLEIWSVGSFDDSHTGVVHAPAAPPPCPIQGGPLKGVASEEWQGVSEPASDSQESVSSPHAPQPTASAPAFASAQPSAPSAFSDGFGKLAFGDRAATPSPLGTGFGSAPVDAGIGSSQPQAEGGKATGSLFGSFATSAAAGRATVASSAAAGFFQSGAQPIGSLFGSSQPASTAAPASPSVFGAFGTSSWQQSSSSLKGASATTGVQFTTGGVFNTPTPPASSAMATTTTTTAFPAFALPPKTETRGFGAGFTPGKTTGQSTSAADATTSASRTQPNDQAPHGVTPGLSVVPQLQPREAVGSRSSASESYEHISENETASSENDGRSSAGSVDGAADEGNAGWDASQRGEQAPSFRVKEAPRSEGSEKVQVETLPLRPPRRVAPAPDVAPPPPARPTPTPALVRNMRAALDEVLNVAPAAATIKEPSQARALQKDFNARVAQVRQLEARAARLTEYITSLRHDDTFGIVRDGAVQHATRTLEMAEAWYTSCALPELARLRAAQHENEARMEAIVFLLEDADEDSDAAAVRGFARGALGDDGDDVDDELEREVWPGHEVRARRAPLVLEVAHATIMEQEARVDALFRSLCEVRDSLRAEREAALYRRVRAFTAPQYVDCSTPAAVARTIAELREYAAELRRRLLAQKNALRAAAAARGAGFGPRDTPLSPHLFATPPPSAPRPAAMPTPRSSSRTPPPTPPFVASATPQPARYQHAQGCSSLGVEAATPRSQSLAAGGASPWPYAAAASAGRWTPLSTPPPRPPQSSVSAGGSGSTAGPRGSAGERKRRVRTAVDAAHSRFSSAALSSSVTSPLPVAPAYSFERKPTRTLSKASAPAYAPAPAARTPPVQSAPVRSRKSSRDEGAPPPATTVASAVDAAATHGDEGSETAQAGKRAAGPKPLREKMLEAALKRETVLKRTGSAQQSTSNLPTTTDAPPVPLFPSMTATAARSSQASPFTLFGPTSGASTTASLFGSLAASGTQLASSDAAAASQSAPSSGPAFGLTAPSTTRSDQNILGSFPTASSAAASSGAKGASEGLQPPAPTGAGGSAGQLFSSGLKSSSAGFGASAPAASPAKSGSASLQQPGAAASSLFGPKSTSSEATPPAEPSSAAIAAAPSAPQTAGAGSAGAASSSSLFGGGFSSSAAFGAGTSSLFGSIASGASTSSLFGNAAATSGNASSASLFGSAPAFGSTAASSSPSPHGSHLSSLFSSSAATTSAAQVDAAPAASSATAAAPSTTSVFPAFVAPTTSKPSSAAAFSLFGSSSSATTATVAAAATMATVTAPASGEASPAAAQPSPSATASAGAFASPATTAAVAATGSSGAAELTATSDMFAGLGGLGKGGAAAPSAASVAPPAASSAPVTGAAAASLLTPPASSLTAAATASPSPLFGSSATANTASSAAVSAFAGGFGGAGVFASSTGNAFSPPQQQQSASPLALGAASATSAPVSSTLSAFSGTAAALSTGSAFGGGGFGTPAPAFGAFASASQAMGSGQTAGFGQSSGFGQPAAFGSSFGQPAQLGAAPASTMQSTFGANAQLGAAPASTMQSTFGANAPSGFGQAPSMTPPFAGAGAASAFGQIAQSAPAFGQSTGSPGSGGHVFGSSFQQQGSAAASTASAFGAFAQSQSPGSGFAAFAQQQQQQQPSPMASGGFGSAAPAYGQPAGNAGFSAFGAMASGNTAPAFGGSTNVFGSSMSAFGGGGAGGSMFGSGSAFGGGGAFSGQPSQASNTMSAMFAPRR